MVGDTAGTRNAVDMWEPRQSVTSLIMETQFSTAPLNK